MKKKNIILGVTAGVAIYKSCSLIRMLRKRSFTVKVIMTPNATKLIAPKLFESLTDQKVYVEMFDSMSFRRGHEYVLTDAIMKRLEAETPYKIVSDRDVADTVLSGQITSISSGVLSGERFTGTPLEKETIMRVAVSWKNLKTGELLINNETIVGSSTYSDRLAGQDFDYSANLAANRAAVRVVELMEKGW